MIDHSQPMIANRPAVLTHVDTDTTAVCGIANAEFPFYYTMRRPRNFVLSTTFDF